MKEQDLGVKWFNTAFYPTTHTGRAYGCEDGVLPRLRKDIITLFTPWGPRYSWEERGCEIQTKDKEVKVLLSFSAILNTWQQNMPNKQFQWIFLGADIYGTRINHLPDEVVTQYFISLKRRISELLPLGAQFHLWSEFDSSTQERREHIRQHLPQLIPYKIRVRAEETARKMGKGSATDYLTERLVEAFIMEELYSPIKMSAVARHKNEGVDGNLPCLYFIPPELHAPWF
jgi:hypothetical protein